MKKLLLASAATALVAGSAMAESHMGPVKIGIILGFTGPLESITPDMAGGAELAINEVNESGAFMGGATIEAVRADSTCIDSAAATAAAERLITNDGVAGIMGADCSGVTGAILQNVARANGVVMISPSATSPALSEAEDDGLFFRTAPSDARQGEIMSKVIMDRGIDEVALTYTNNDYGKGLADSFQKAFEADGGSVTISAARPLWRNTGKELCSSPSFTTSPSSTTLRSPGSTLAGIGVVRKRSSSVRWPFDRSMRIGIG